MTYGILTGLLFIFGASALGVGLFRRYSLRWGMLDVPNERSSHVTPTPRGGGVVVAILVLLFYWIASSFMETPFSVGFVAGAFLIISVSWLDDLYSLPFFIRLAVHFIAAGLVIWSEGPITSIGLPLFGTNFSFGWFAVAFTALWIVWLVNAYNFMDGIDGIASLQAVVAGLGWLAVGFFNGLPIATMLGGALAAASLGFLIFNWQPAKIFMGDAGSAFLGFSFAVIPLLVGRSLSTDEKGDAVLFGIAFVWIFLFDSIFTFCRRLVLGEIVWRAHRSHIYQRFVISGVSHAGVTTAYGILAAMVALSALVGNLVLCSALILAPVFLLAMLFVRNRKESDGERV